MPVRNSRPCPREGNYRRDCLWSLRWYFRHAVNNQLCRLNIAFSLWTIWLISSPIYQCGRKMETINKCVCGNVRPRQSISSTVLTHSSAYRSLTLLGWNCCWFKKEEIIWNFTPQKRGVIFYLPFPFGIKKEFKTTLTFPSSLALPKMLQHHLPSRHPYDLHRYET